MKLTKRKTMAGSVIFVLSILNKKTHAFTDSTTRTRPTEFSTLRNSTDDDHERCRNWCAEHGTKATCQWDESLDNTLDGCGCEGKNDSFVNGPPYFRFLKTNFGFLQYGDSQTLGFKNIF